ncbi:MAG: hypothetical protein AB8F78_16135 [Saprospiraceae bacterium]
MRTLLLSILFTIGFSLPSTLLVSCGCECDPVLAFFDVEGIAQFNHTAQLPEGDFVTPDTDEVIDFESYVETELFFDVFYIASCSPQPVNWQLGLITSASAWSCDCDDPGMSGAKSEALVALNITVLEDFNAIFKAGDNVTSLFEIDAQQGTPELLERQGIIMTLNTKPDHEDPIQFRVDLILSSGEHYSATTAAVGFR